MFRDEGIHKIVVCFVHGAFVRKIEMHYYYFGSSFLGGGLRNL